MDVKKNRLWLGIIFITICIITVSLIIRNFDNKEGSNAKKASVKIGISIYNHNDTFISGLVDYLREEAKLKEQEDITIILDIKNAGGIQATQNYQIESFIKQEYDLLCINLVDRTDASIAIDMAMNANIPIIFFNRELVEKDLERWDQLFYVGAVALESGIMQGKIVVDACKKDFDNIDKNKDGVLQYVMLEGEPGHQDSSVRTERVINTITEAGINVEKLGNEIANWNRAQAESRMSQWLKNFGDQIEIVIANNDDMALGAIDAMKKEKVINPPVVVGIDGTKIGLEAVENGDMIGTVLNDGRGQAKGIIDLAYALAVNGDLPSDIISGKYIRKPHIMVTRENINEVKIK